MNRQDFTLFYSLPLDTLDWSNLTRSKVKRVMLPLHFAEPATLARLSRMGVRVVLRLDEGAYYGQNDPYAIRARLEELMQHGAVEAVVVGVEPENGLDLTYAGDWGHDLAQRHAAATDRVRRALSGLPLKVVSAGWTMSEGAISEDDPPHPGAISWREHTRFAYSECDGNGFHLYLYGWESLVDIHRMKWALKRGQELYHKPLWIDELGVIRRTPLESMTAYVQIATMLLGPLGERVEMLAPFVSNGTPGGHWDSRYLLREPACYDLLAQFIEGVDFPV